MIINGPGHWGWLMWEIATYAPEIIREYKIYEAPDGFMFGRKIFHNNAEVVIIKRTSDKCYKLSMYRGETVEFTSFRKAIDVVEYLKEKLSENPFINKL